MTYSLRAVGVLAVGGFAFATARVLRAALLKPALRKYIPCLHTLITISSPLLGLLDVDDTLGGVLQRELV